MTQLQKQVYIAVQQIPRGRTASYKEIARSIGRPRAWRAVGSALKKNHDPNVPCHRVIRSNGAPGGYNRGGAKIKSAILEHEDRLCASKY